ncbi:MAG: hypothetical protein JWP10_1307, partial [Nocardioidaceae bacterium]|nr:hypothetical protein [Nocardioidaceae bacterium]
TPLGLFVAWIGGATVVRRGRGTYVAGGYRWNFPVASAFTIGSVITSKHDTSWLLDRPVLMSHEDRHTTQYAWCVGVLMLPLYFLSVGVSYALAGDHSSYNPFERLANLADGNYPPALSRRAKARLHP